MRGDALDFLNGLAGEARSAAGSNATTKSGRVNPRAIGVPPSIGRNNWNWWLDVGEHNNRVKNAA